MAGALWWLVFTQEPSRGPPRETSLEQKTFLAPRTLQGFQELCVRRGGQRPNIRTKDVPSAPVTWETAKVSRVLCQEMGAEANTDVSYCFPNLVASFQHMNLLGVGASCLFSFKLWFSRFLVTMDNFRLYPGHFVYYVKRLWVFFKKKYFLR